MTSPSDKKPLATPLQDWRETLRLIGLDMDDYAVWYPRGKRYSVGPRWILFVYLVLASQTFAAVAIFRMQGFLRDAGFGVLSTICSRINQVIYSVTIGHQVRSTGAFHIVHGQIVLDGPIVLGDRVYIAPFVTMGLIVSAERGYYLEGPTVGDDVYIGTGSRILGPVTIGDRAKIGANAVVMDDVPADHTAVGAPARSRPSVDFLKGLKDLPPQADCLPGLSEVRPGSGR